MQSQSNQKSPNEDGESFAPPCYLNSWRQFSSSADAMRKACGRCWGRVHCQPFRISHTLGALLLAVAFACDLADARSLLREPSGSGTGRSACLKGSLANATNVNCQLLGLQRVPANLSASIEVLRLNRNFIRVLHGDDLLTMPNLKELQVADNLLHSIAPGSFHNCRHLKILNLADNKLKSLDADCFGNVSHLEKLWLRNNDIKLFSAIYDVLEGQGETIRLLNLQGNRLVDNLSTTSFPSMVSLTNLVLSNNHLTAVGSDAFLAFPSLRQLFLSHNLITSVAADAFASLSKLTILEMSNNSIFTLLPGTFKDLSSLRSLDLKFNRISSLAAPMFVGLTSLTSLIMVKNNIHQLDSLAVNVSSLLSLSLSRNSLDVIADDAFDGLPNLLFLYIGESNVSEHNFPRNISAYMPKLKTLFLLGSNFSTIPRNMLQGLYQLDFLDLSQTRLHTVPLGSLRNLDKLTNVRLQRNPWACTPQLCYISYGSMTIGKELTEKCADVCGHCKMSTEEATIQCPDNCLPEELANRRVCVPGQTEVNTVTINTTSRFWIQEDSTEASINVSMQTSTSATREQTKLTKRSSVGRAHTQPFLLVAVILSIFF